MLRLFFALVCAFQLAAVAHPTAPIDFDLPKITVVERHECLTPLHRGLFWDREVPLWGGRVREDRFATTEAKYVNPNEANHHVLAPYLKGRGGVYVGLGTFRVLNNAVASGFKDIVMLDYDLGTAAFNRLNLQLIATATDRYEYLHTLFFGTRQSELLTAVRSGIITETEFVWRISRFPTGGRRNARLKELKLRLPLFSSSYSNQIAAWTEAPAYEGKRLTPPRDIFDLFDQERFQVNEWVYRAAAMQKAPEMWRESYLGNDEYFKRLQQLIRDGHVHVLCGDLSGETALRDLSAVLSAAKKAVGVFDLSNAPEWLESDPDLLRRERYFANLRALPWQTRGVLLATGGFTQIQTEHWAQSLISQRHLDELQKLTVTKPLNGTRQSGWRSAHDKIFGPGGAGTAVADSIFVWE